jgi:hypothetical protein
MLAFLLLQMAVSSGSGTSPVVTTNTRSYICCRFGVSLMYATPIVYPIHGSLNGTGLRP